jgi:hypothetical protein
MLYFLLGVAAAPILRPILGQAIRGVVKGGLLMSEEVKKNVDQARSEVDEVRREAASQVHSH